jgi:hypothetical protein
MDLGNLAARLEASACSPSPLDIEFLQQFREDSENFPTAQALLTDHLVSPPVQVFLASSLRELASKYASHWNPSFAVAICDWVLQTIASFDGAVQVQLLAELFGIVVCNFWELSDIQNRFNLVSVFLDSQETLSIAIGLRLFAGTIPEFIANAKHHHLRYTDFGHRMIPSCFELCRTFLISHRTIPIVYASAVSVFSLCLKYGTNSKGVVTQVGGMQKHCSSTKTIRLLFQIYRETHDFALLEGLRTIISTEKSSFKLQKGEQIVACFSQELQPIIESRSGLDDRRNAFHCSGILSQWGRTARLVEPRDIRLVESVLQWTLSLFEHFSLMKEATELYMNILGFWTSVCTTLSAKSGPLELQSRGSECVGAFFRSFLSFLTNLVISGDQEILFIVMNRPEWIAPVENFVALNPDESLDFLFAFFEERHSELEMALFLRILACLEIGRPQTALQKAETDITRDRILAVALCLLKHTAQDCILFEKSVVEFIAIYPDCPAMYEHAPSLVDRLLTTLRIVPACPLIVINAVMALANIPVPLEIAIQMANSYRVYVSVSAGKCASAVAVHGLSVRTWVFL